MKLSIVIVNYNVKYFLEQCLNSVKRAVEGIDVEVFVVDNNSVDSSVSMLKEKFPEVKLIENRENLGFSRANNQAIKASRGEYVLLLNPDTVVEDDTFKKCIAFMDAHQDAGGLGVKMIDGKGNFLPESKRGFPSPSTAFYKIFGLSKLFPRSRTFGKYHLGYLDKNEIHEVDVLAGAFMMLRKKVLDEIGFLDESFFMYGEDIDLSYRINKSGYKNYYFPETRIIHYKGESTKKSSINYVFIFYNAMVIFARKHFSKKNARLYTFLINMAIWFRASLAVITRFLKQVFLPILDFIFIYVGILLIKGYWEQHVIFTEGGHYPDEFIYIILPAYILIWLLSVYFSGGYDKPVKLLKVFQGMAIGTVVILVSYALFPESWRFSRAIILLGTIWGLAAMVGLRALFSTFKVQGVKFGETSNKRFLIIGEKEEARRVTELLQKTQLAPAFIGLVKPSGKVTRNDGFIGTLNQIRDIITIYKINEVIFCSKDIPPQQIIDKMSELHNFQVDYKIAPEDSLSIIGSNSINTSGDLYIININAIDKPVNKRNKRLFDILISLILLGVSPAGIFIVRQPAGFLRNIFLVLAGRRSWMGYAQADVAHSHKLPSIKKGVLNPADAFRKTNISSETLEKLNLIYVRDYKVWTDLNVIWKGFKELGR
ncbi:MAG: glycosyltransferase family 2 protein [Bacteroidales bacterium]|nr:glycosyltransferase family 2 protein [Bacteroidales bacterium]MCF8343087.1 glycosyltransferase family 2 protein [Bacteroidales bacterium]MCF8375349.1 glycosyltransferase family 2 protein [Bacteroidales bacterium]MCF8400205.1 glycosyltransferase family 2 protein [Bacteroidales bacterium]